MPVAAPKPVAGTAVVAARFMIEVTASGTASKSYRANRRRWQKPNHASPTAPSASVVGSGTAVTRA
jgi:hypothetical protein